MRRIVAILLLVLQLGAAERIVTLAPAAAEMVAALGMADAIVAVSDYTLYPPQLASRPSVGGYFAIAPETVLAYRPTLVVGMDYQRSLLHTLERFGVDTVALRLGHIADIETALRTLGKRLGKSAQARQRIAAIENAAAHVPKLTTPQKVLIVFGSSGGLGRGVYAAGPSLFFDEILHLCGAQNALAGATAVQPVLGPEAIIAANPQQVLILFGPKDRFDALTVRRQWQALPIDAAKHGRIRLLQSDYLLIPGPRIDRTITTLCEALQ